MTSSGNPETQETTTFGLVLDIDGVFIHDGIPITEAFDALRLIIEHNIPFTFVTNGGGDTEAKKLEFMKRLFQDALNDFTLRNEHLILAHTPMAELVHAGGECHGKKVLCLSREKELGFNVLVSYGFQRENLVHIDDLAEMHPFALPYQWNGGNEYTQRKHRESTTNPLIIEAVVGIDLVKDWHVSLQLLLDIFMNNGRIIPQPQSTQEEEEEGKVKLFVCNPDMVYPGQLKNRITVGSFFECLTHLYTTLTKGKLLDITWYGKPKEATYRFASSQLQTLAEGRKLTAVYGIGDNTRSDIQGANNAKQFGDGIRWQSVLVRTGNFPDHLENDEENPADIVEANILTAVKTILKREGSLHKRT